jgi:hypothetical protein
MKPCFPTLCTRRCSVNKVLQYLTVGCGVMAMLAASVAEAQTGRPPVPTATGTTSTLAPGTALPTPPPSTAPVLPVPKAIASTIKMNLAPAPADYTTITDFIKANVARLASDDADASSGGRNDLVAGGASPSPAQPASTSYLSFYMSTLSRELTALLGKKPSIRVKLNVAIVTARVAESSKTILPPAIQLQNLIAAEMQDANDAVAIWGMKAAAAALSAPNQPKPNDVLLNLIIPTLEKHKLSGAMTSEAYNALQDSNPTVISTLIKVYEKRIALYKDGIPQEPLVERAASNHLTVQSEMWSKMSDSDHLRVMNLIADLLAAASKASQDSDYADSIDQLRALVIDTCKAVWVVANGNPAMADLAAEALRASKMGNNTPPATIVQVINPLVEGMRKAFPMGASAGTGRP